jgi:hypothetical protein
VNREAELNAPSRVACSDLLAVMVIAQRFIDDNHNELLTGGGSSKAT